MKEPSSCNVEVPYDQVLVSYQRHTRGRVSVAIRGLSVSVDHECLRLHRTDLASNNLSPSYAHAILQKHQVIALLVQAQCCKCLAMPPAWSAAHACEM
jgi:hypothetical protein